MQDAQNNATSNEYRSVPISILVESATNPAQAIRREEPRRTGRLCAQAHKRPFVSLVILWPRTPNGARELVVPAPKDT